MTEEQRFKAVQAQIDDLLDHAAKKSTGNAAGAGYTLLAAKMATINEQSPYAKEAQQPTTDKEVNTDKTPKA